MKFIYLFLFTLLSSINLAAIENKPESNFTQCLQNAQEELHDYAELCAYDVANNSRLQCNEAIIQLAMSKALLCYNAKRIKTLKQQMNENDQKIEENNKKIKNTYESLKSDYITISESLQ